MYEIEKCTNIKGIRVVGGTGMNKLDNFMLRGKSSGSVDRDRLAWLFYLENEAKYANSCRRVCRNYVWNDCLDWLEVRELLTSYIVEWVSEWDGKGDVYAYTIYKLRYKVIDYIRNRYGQASRHVLNGTKNGDATTSSGPQNPNNGHDITNRKYHTPYTEITNIGAIQDNSTSDDAPITIDTVAPPIDIDAIIDGDELYKLVHEVLDIVAFTRFIQVVMYTFTINEIVYLEHKQGYNDTTINDVEECIGCSIWAIRKAIPGAFIGVRCVETLLDMVHDRKYLGEK